LLQEGVDATRTANQQQLLKLRELQLNHVRFVYSLLLLNQGGVLNKLRVLNLETMELSDTPQQVG
jgi:hypothetical protein